MPESSRADSPQKDSDELRYASGVATRTDRAIETGVKPLTRICYFLMTYSDCTQTFETLVDLLRYRAVHQADRTAYTFLVDGENESLSLTYAQLDRVARAIAAEVQGKLDPGERALLLYPPGLDYIAAFFGCLYAGVVAVPAYPPRPNRSLYRLQAIAENAQASLALTVSPILTNIERRVDRAPELDCLHWIASDLLQLARSHDWQTPDLDGDSLAFLQYTSGSTATPKGVRIGHGNLLANLERIQQAAGLSEQTIGLFWLPPYHDMGLIGGILQPLYTGCPTILMSPLMFLQNPWRWLNAISRYRANTSGGPNFAYDFCARKIAPEQLEHLDLSCWEIAFNGAEPVAAETLDRFSKTFAPCGFRRETFYPCYGMAEATLMISGGDKQGHPVCQTVDAAALEQNRVVPTDDDRPGTRTLVGCGRTLADQIVAIAHPETLTRCAEGEIGEIWVRGPSVASGYWNNPQATRDSFEAYFADTGEGPFLRTGDLGFVDRHGEVFVTGRLKDLIIVNGRNHYPQDIERLVERVHPLIRPSCCAAFSIDADGEERLVVVAEVERRYHQLQRQATATVATDDTGTEIAKEVIQAIQGAISREFDLPVYTVELLKVGSIPKTSSGKIQRHACRAEFLAGRLEAIAP
ncbi:fatty acyl-AMP ligase [Oxynema aestuarii]|jgi:acyl-CoA synthetase (AMP-forming)/AMP-acid ligase II|nr:fatty acyl-AMP ligase [Oxynema aestuarii]